ncbi:MAG: pyridoxamine 5'-phosphate oxidase family protein [Planctomycetes bacterium]|nr:pyridoxamine 5'-phosphate oxidase family protein [Planctomycetota bacterium]
MTKEEILEFVTKNPVFSLATSDGNQPHVRMIMIYRADENGIIFTTGRDKDVNKQLSANPAVELCFYNADEGCQVRIEGTVEMLDDLELKMRIVEQFTFLKPWVESEGYEILIPFCLKNGKAIVWTMETNLQPKQYIQL